MYLLVFGGGYCPIVYRVWYLNISQVVQDFFRRIISHCLGVFPRSQAIYNCWTILGAENEHGIWNINTRWKRNGHEPKPNEFGFGAKFQRSDSWTCDMNDINLMLRRWMLMLAPCTRRFGCDCSTRDTIASCPGFSLRLVLEANTMSSNNLQSRQVDFAGRYHPILEGTMSWICRKFLVGKWFQTSTDQMASQHYHMLDQHHALATDSQYPK